MGQQQGAEREGEQAVRTAGAAHGDDLAVEVFVLDFGALFTREIGFDTEAFERIHGGVLGQSFGG